MNEDLETKLAKIKVACRLAIELGEKATPGPWSDESDWPRVFSYAQGHPVKQVAQCCERIVKRTKIGASADTAFIAHARTFSPAAAQALLTAIEVLEGIKQFGLDDGTPTGGYMIDATDTAFNTIAAQWPDL